MAEFDSKGRRLISVVRVLEYHGTEEWITKIFEHNRIPAQGEFQTGNEGCFIRSGLVVWDIEKAVDEGGGSKVIPIPPGSGTVQ
jgi:hypothetical protein